jgi:hypothetical protein
LEDVLKTYQVIFDGFETTKQAMEFAAWYEDQGEQDSDIWLTERGFTAYNDSKKDFYKQEKNGNVTVYIKISKRN